MSPKSAKAVPQAIKNKIIELRDIEITLGHLPPESWTLNALQERVDSEKFKHSSVQLAAQTETLFSEICEELTEVNFKPADIANIINADLCYTGGPRYCNESEVREALGLHSK